MRLFRPVAAVTVLLLATPAWLIARPNPRQDAELREAVAAVSVTSPADFKVRGVALDTALVRLARSSGASLAFSPSLLPLEREVTCDCEDLTVGEVLDRLLADSGFNYSLVGRQILIEAEDRDTPAEVRGRVTAAETGDGLEAANVLVEGTRVQTLTDERGGFRLSDLSPGDRVLVVSKLGYRTAKVRVSVSTDANTTVDIALEAQPISLSSLVIEAETELPTERSVLEFPAARTVVSERAYFETGATRAEEILQYQPGIIIQDETGTGSKPNIGVRGLNARRSQWVAMLVDDVPLEPGPYGHTGLSIFPYLPERTETMDILRGGVAVRHGPNTVGGVINMISTPIPVRPQLLAQVGFGSDQYKSGRVAIGGSGGNTGALAEFAGKWGDGFRDNAKFEMYNYNLKLQHAFSPVTSLRLSFDGYNEPRVGLPGALSPQTMETRGLHVTEHPHDFFDGYRYGGAAKFNTSLTATDELRVLAYYYTTFRNFGLDRPGGAAIRETPRKFWVWAVEPRYSFSIGDHNRISIGARYMNEDATFERPQYAIDPATGTPAADTTQLRTEDFEVDAISFYIDDEISLSDRLTAYPGVRVEVVDYLAHRRILSDEPDNTKAGADFIEWLPGISVNYQAGDAVVLFGNFHRSFRGPQNFQVDYERSDLQDLNGERGANIEAGIRLGPSSGFYGEAIGFLIDFDNQIERDPAFEDVFRNVGATKFRGIETRAVLAFGPFVPSLRGVEATATYTYVRAEIQTGDFSGNRPPNAPDHRFGWRLKYTSPVGLAFHLDGLNVGDSFEDASNIVEEDELGTLGILPSYNLINAGLTFDIPGSDLVLTATGKNLGEEEYFHRDFRGRVPAPGRTWIVQLRKMFDLR